jgi:hypothetical protein
MMLLQRRSEIVMSPVKSSLELKQALQLCFCGLLWLFIGLEKCHS